MTQNKNKILANNIFKTDINDAEYQLILRQMSKHELIALITGKDMLIKSFIQTINILKNNNNNNNNILKDTIVK